jgi:hypothetical protein
MGIWKVAWYTPLLVEANKFWFCSLCASIARNVSGLKSANASVQVRPTGTGKAVAVDRPYIAAATPFLRRTIANACDLALPGTFLGWITMNDSRVGAAMIVSTLLVWSDVWASAQT